MKTGMLKSRSKQAATQKLACPKCCHAPTAVFDSRSCAVEVRRRPCCVTCGYRFTTRERVWGVHR